MRLATFVVVFQLCLIWSASGSQAALLVSRSTGALNLGYGRFDYSVFTDLVDSLAVDGVIVADNLKDTTQVLDADALYIDQRWTGGRLSAEEKTNLLQFIATGKHVVFIGENTRNFGDWNNDFLDLVGGELEADIPYQAVLTPIRPHLITKDIESLNVLFAGVASGGSPLFSPAVISLWGDSDNVLVILDTGLLRATIEKPETNNYKFIRNVAQFLFVPKPTTTIPFDIKPGGDTNPINLKSKGVLPVAILSTEDFNVSDINVSTLLFGDPALLDENTTGISPLRYSFEDVSDDGLLDLSLKFSLPDAIDYGVLGPDTIEGLITGELFDGTPIEGLDLIRIVPPKGANEENVVSISFIPEPTTFALVACSLLGLVGRRRRR